FFSLCWKPSAGSKAEFHKSSLSDVSRISRNAPSLLLYLEVVSRKKKK
ncbi:hypothetical protein Anapl_13477, partial [Anas platyrhynchos]